MQTELGAHVRTSDGQDVGTIERLIVDPATRRVKAAVIRKGMLLPRDVEVPLHLLEPGADGEVRLRYSAGQVDTLPPFDESQYTGVPPADYLPFLGYPETGFYWPALAIAGGMPEERTDEARRQQRENAVIGVGSMVVSRDERHVGDVHDVVFDAESARVSRVIVREGFIFTHDLSLPATLIDRVGDETVYLTATADEVAAQTAPPHAS